MTLSSFQERAQAARKQSGTLFTSIVPLVEYEQREAWENYTLHDPDGWIQEGLDYQKKWNPIKLGVSLPNIPSDVHPGYIVQDDWELGFIRDEGYGPYFPVSHVRCAKYCIQMSVCLLCINQSSNQNPIYPSY